MTELQKKPVLQMPKSLKRMLALMPDKQRKVYQPIMMDAVRTEHVNRLKRMRSKGKEDSEE